MGTLFGCLRGGNRKMLGRPELSENYDKKADWQIAVEKPNEIVMGYFLFKARHPVFDFVGRVATFRARLPDNRVLGLNSAPIPEEIFNNITVVKKSKRSKIYCIDLLTGGEDLTPYFRPVALQEYDDTYKAYQIDPS